MIMEDIEQLNLLWRTQSALQKTELLWSTTQKVVKGALDKVELTAKNKEQLNFIIAESWTLTMNDEKSSKGM